MNEQTKKKNVLDLHFQKYLTIASTSVIVAFTYAIGVGIAFLTRQIRLDDFISMGALFVISFGVLGTCSIIFFNSIYHIRNIPQLVKKL